MPTSNTEELGRFLKCTVIGRGVFGPCACCFAKLSQNLHEIERTWTRGGRVPLAPLHPPLMKSLVKYF